MATSKVRAKTASASGASITEAQARKAVRAVLADLTYDIAPDPLRRRNWVLANPVKKIRMSFPSKRDALTAAKNMAPPVRIRVHDRKGNRTNTFYVSNVPDGNSAR